MMVLWSVTLKIGALTKLGLFFPVVCFIHVFDQTLAEQLYRDKGLLNLLFQKDLDRPSLPAEALCWCVCLCSCVWFWLKLASNLPFALFQLRSARLELWPPPKLEPRWSRTAVSVFTQHEKLVLEKQPGESVNWINISAWKNQGLVHSGFLSSSFRRNGAGLLQADTDASQEIRNGRSGKLDFLLKASVYTLLSVIQ